MANSKKIAVLAIIAGILMTATATQGAKVANLTGLQTFKRPSKSQKVQVSVSSPNQQALKTKEVNKPVSPKDGDLAQLSVKFDMDHENKTEQDIKVTATIYNSSYVDIRYPVYLEITYPQREYVHGNHYLTCNPKTNSNCHIENAGDAINREVIKYSEVPAQTQVSQISYSYIVKGAPTKVALTPTAYRLCINYVGDSNLNRAVSPKDGDYVCTDWQYNLKDSGYFTYAVNDIGPVPRDLGHGNIVRPPIRLPVLPPMDK